MIRTLEAQSRGIFHRGGAIWDEKERIGGRPTFILEKVCEEGIGRWVCVRSEGEEEGSRPPLKKGVVVLYGPPAEELKTSVDL